MRWSDEARGLLDFLYRFWAERRRPPNLSDIHGATGESVKDIRRGFRELQEGFAVVFTDGTLNLGLQKVTPFSATPTPVSFEHGGSFHSYVGCPAEAITVSALPMFNASVLTIRSSCACCFEPMVLEMRNMDLISAPRAEPIISIVGSPYEWEWGVPADAVCDSIHFVADAQHAKRYESQIGRRGITLTLSQLQKVAAPVGRARMWDPDWPPMRVSGSAMVEGFAAVGADVSIWRDA